MAWTTPGTATAGSVLTAQFLNTNVRDNLNSHESRFKEYGRTSNISMGPAAWTSTTFAGSSEMFTDLTWTADGSSYLVDLTIPLVYNTGVANQTSIWLSDGGTTQLGLMALFVLTTGVGAPLNARFFYTPSAGSQSVNVRVSVNTGSTSTYSGTGGTNYVPAVLRVLGAG
jgi:hypothetical protein